MNESVSANALDLMLKAIAGNYSSEKNFYYPDLQIKHRLASSWLHQFPTGLIYFFTFLFNVFNFLS